MLLKIGIYMGGDGFGRVVGGGSYLEEVLVFWCLGFFF